MTTSTEDSVRRLSTTILDTSIDRIKRELKTLNEELRILMAERERRRPSYDADDD
jgi:hypothetical protein